MKIFALLAVFSLLSMVLARAESLYDIKIKDIDGQDTSLAPYKGKVLLIVNVASHCGFTPQYTALEAAYQTNQASGLVVLGFPATSSPARSRAPTRKSNSFAPANTASPSPCLTNSRSMARTGIRCMRPWPARPPPFPATSGGTSRNSSSAATAGSSSVSNPR